MTEEEQKEREMMEFVAEFIFKFRERFGDGVRVTVKPINKKTKMGKIGDVFQYRGRTRRLPQNKRKTGGYE